MKTLRTLISGLSLALMFACGGGSNDDRKNSPLPPKPTTYGVFRNLKGAAGPVAGVKGAEMATSTVNITPRAYHRAIQMMNGKILLAGGDMSSATPTMDIFDPATETFTQSAAIPYRARYYQTGIVPYNSSFTMINLPNGKVWIGGGVFGGDPDSQFYDLYDPATDTIEVKMVATHILNPIDDGYYIGNNKLLLFLSGGSVSRYDLDIEDLEFIANDKMPIDPNDTRGIIPYTLINTSTIQDETGNIFLFGGSSTNAYFDNQGNRLYRTDSVGFVFKYSVADGSWTRLQDLETPREGASLILLPNNKIGVYGGQRFVGTPGASSLTVLQTVEIYDVTTNTIATSLDLTGKRTKAASTYLQTGYSFISGGLNNSGQYEDSELVHNAASNFSGSTGLMLIGRFGHRATTLNNGLVLITGGNGGKNASSTAEIFDPQAKIYVSYLSETIVVGGTSQLAAKNAAGETLAVTYASSKPDVATVDSNGLVTTLTEGTVEITVTSSSDTTAVATVRLRVLPQ